MKNLFYSAFKVSYHHTSLLIIRLIFGFEMAFYGLDKMLHYSENAQAEFWVKDVNFLGLGGPVTIGLVIFSELFCSVLLIFGLFTKLALIPLLFTMFYIFGILDHFEIVSSGDNGIGINSAFKFFVFYGLLFFTGPGKYSLDYRFFKI